MIIIIYDYDSDSTSAYDSQFYDDALDMDQQYARILGKSLTMRIFERKIELKFIIHFS